MALTFRDICWAIIAITIVLIFLFGVNITDS